MRHHGWERFLRKETFRSMQCHAVQLQKMLVPGRELPLVDAEGRDRDVSTGSRHLSAVALDSSLAEAPEDTSGLGAAEESLS